MNKSNKLIFALAFTLITLSACQTPSQPEHVVKFDRNTDKTPVEEVLPVIKITQGPNHSDLKLRSQTSRYLNAEKSAIEITLSSSKTAFCENQAPALKEGEAELKIIVKAKDGKKAITKEDLSKDTDFESIATYKTTAGEVTISGDQFKSLSISDLNAAILRGNIQISAKDFSVEGEYFTAICK